MKDRSKRQKSLRAMFLALVCTACGVHCSYAAGKAYDIDLNELKKSPYDLNLKELHPSPLHRSKSPHRKQTPKAAQPSEPTTNDAPKGSSSYTVQPGDYPLLILIRHYGLSQAAAEKILPQVIQLNNLRDPRKLTVGQRLLIPLVPAGQAPPKDIVSSSPPPATAALPAVQPPVTPAEAQPDAPPVVRLPVVAPFVTSGVPPIVSAAVPIVVSPDVQPPAIQAPIAQPSAAETAPTREVQLHTAPPCQLARQVAEQLGLRIPAVTALIPAATVSMAFKDQKLVVACGMTAAETYTSQRLLARSGAQLLLFDGDEPPGEVISELADSLGISIRPVNGDTGDKLPATYVLSAIGVAGSDVRLTILSSPESREKSKP
ncbi:MAG: LysM peptidoglycan-binding domain-containing protein [Desulfuromonadales bacterium]|nr:LysM peptidoglycan-binding domain-containing protein [Desulfuromonadales bacterium]